MTSTEKLQAEIDVLKAKIAEQSETIQHLKILNDWYIEQLKLKAKEKFGKTSEKADDNRLSLFDLVDLFNEAETVREPINTEPTEETVIAAHTRKKAKRGSKLENLPVEVIEYKLTDEELVCEECGSVLSEMKKETRKELQIIPAQIKIVEHVTYVYSCRNCYKEGIAGVIKKAESPKAIIPKSMVSPGMLAYVMNQKYTMALPLYRQEQEFKRLGVEITRQNLSNWIIKGAELLKPLAAEMKQSLLSEELLHADETTLEVLHEPGRAATMKSYMWVYRTSHYNKHPVILYEYTEGRSGDFAKAFLKDWSGKYLHCDGYNGYKKIENKELCGCFAHVKRKFHDAVTANPNNKEAATGEKYIRKLFAVEHSADKKEVSIEERLRLRQTMSKKILDDFYSWIDSTEDKILPQSLVGKAITYAKNQKEYLMKFLNDGRIQLSNNLCEQSVKPFVTGRKNWLFANTPNGASSSALIYSVMQTAIANNLKPQMYLEYVFMRMQENRGVKISELLPWSETIPDKCKNLQITAV